MGSLAAEANEEAFDIGNRFAFPLIIPPLATNSDTCDAGTITQELLPTNANPAHAVRNQYSENQCDSSRWVEIDIDDHLREENVLGKRVNSPIDKREKPQ